MAGTDHAADLAQAVRQGMEQLQAGCLTEAEAAFRRALVLKPDSAEACKNLGVALAGQGKRDAALAEFRKALEIDPAYVDGHIGVGNIYIAWGRYTDAVTCYRKALTLSPGNDKAYNNLGIALQRIGDPVEAMTCFRRALERNPGFADAYNNLGNVLQALGKPDEAEVNYQQALQLKPDYALAQCNLATVFLLRGKLETGLALYERRFAGADSNLTAMAREVLTKLSDKPRWQGEELRGRALFVWCEQGLGDAIMMMRYLPLLKEKGAGKIIVSCRPELTRLARSLPAVSEVIDAGAPFPVDAMDCHCPVMSLPYAFGTRLETIPDSVPYLTVPSSLAGTWAQRLAAITGLKVGVAWAGSRTQSKDFLRSIPLRRWAPVFAVTGAQFVSLHKGEGAAAAALHDWMSECVDFLDTAALMQQLDLIISVDTAVAHLAGALGKPVWLLNRFESEWRWMLQREDTPWYPTMRIFRQSALHDWDGVLARVADELQALLAGRERN